MLAELWSDVRYRWRALFQRQRMEHELEQELAFHLERETQKGRAAGLTDEESRRQAHVAFGGVERFKEESRRMRGVAILDAIVQDVRYALRALRRNPVFTVTVMLTLGLGIGANAAIFGVVDRLLLRPPPMLHDPAMVHRVYLSWQDRGGIEATEAAMEYTRYLDLQRWTRSFDLTASYAARQMPVGTGAETRELNVGVVSASFFSFFDARPALGRYFVADEDAVPRGMPVAVLGYGLWQSQFGGRHDVVGQELTVGSQSYTIVGVSPRGFSGLATFEPPALWIPMTAYASRVPWVKEVTDYYTRYHWGWLSMIARRKPDVSEAAAAADLSAAFHRSWEQQVALGDGDTPATVAKPRALVASIIEERGPRQTTVAKVAIWVSGVSFVVLLIACANVANLLLARAVRRRREIALRLTVGVGRGRLMAQLLTESLILALLGMTLGLGLAWAGGSLLMTLFAPGMEPPPVLAPRTLAFATLLSVVAGGLTSLAPVFSARRTDLAEALKSGVREGTSRRSRLRAMLLLVQGTLSVALLVGGGLFVRSLYNVRGMRLGYDVDPVLLVEYNLRGLRLGDSAQAALVRQLEGAVREVPSVVRASRALSVPFWSSRSTALYVAGIDSVRRLGRFSMQAGTSEFFATLGTRVVRGRGITSSDDAHAPPVVVVSEAMAKRLWPSRDALGQCMRLDADTMPCFTVVGIAENIHSESFTDDPGYDYYLSVEQYHPEDAALLVRTRSSAAALAEPVRRRLQREMPGAAYVNVTPFRRIVDDQAQSWRVGATMFTAFGLLALALAAIGLYGVLAYDVAQRAHELGVRVALGARRSHMVRVVLRDGARFAVIGIAAGGLTAWAAGPWLAPLLFQVSATDPLVFGGVVLILLTVAVLASVIPAARAARVDPNTALRAE
ncbi:MAG: ADOP family duplicated permease [Gemmatimonadaceae bacterium]